MTKKSIEKTKGTNHEWACHRKKNMNGSQSFEKILKFISNDRNSNKNHNGIQFHTHQTGEVNKSGNILVKIQVMIVLIQFHMGIQINTSNLEIS